MPIQDWTSSSSFTAPFAAGACTLWVIGGGGAGYRDKEGEGTNGRGGGGGGGGYAIGTATLTPGQGYSVTVGAGGGTGNSIGSPGGTSSFSGPGVSVIATGGGAGQDRPGGQGGSPNGNPGSGDGSKEAPGNGAGGAGHYGPNGGYYGAGGNGNTNGNFNATGGSAGFIRLSYEFRAVICSISINNENITTGESATVSWYTENANSISISGIGSVGTQGATVVYPPSGTTNYCLSASGPAGAGSCGCVSITAYPPPVIDTFYIDDDDHHIGDAVRIYWTTTDATNVTLSGSTNAFGANLPSNPVAVDGNHLFYPTIGGFYNATLTAKNPVGKTVTKTISWRTRDETPNDFGFTDNDENTIFLNQNIESNNTSIKGFGPTQYPNNALPIKSNYPIEVQVAGDGVWRSVQEI